MQAGGIRPPYCILAKCHMRNYMKFAFVCLVDTRYVLPLGFNGAPAKLVCLSLLLMCTYVWCLTAIIHPTPNQQALKVDRQVAVYIYGPATFFTGFYVSADALNLVLKSARRCRCVHFSTCSNSRSCLGILFFLGEITNLLAFRNPPRSLPVSRGCWLVNLGMSKCFLYPEGLVKRACAYTTGLANFVLQFLMTVNWTRAVSVWQLASLSRDSWHKHIFATITWTSLQKFTYCNYDRLKKYVKQSSNVARYI